MRALNPERRAVRRMKVWVMEAVRRPVSRSVTAGAPCAPRRIPVLLNEAKNGIQHDDREDRGRVFEIPEENRQERGDDQYNHLVPADCRLLESVNLQAEEAALTGESQPVEKESKALFGREVLLADRRNMVYMGTTLTYGHALAVVTTTGMQTELGKIASGIQNVGREPTPLERRLAQLGRRLAVAALVLVGLVFALGLARGEHWKLVLLTAVSMAVAAVPEGLPAVVTIALALGAQRMLKRRALIRRLPAVETLGSVTVICADKTGTLTENRSPRA